MITASVVLYRNPVGMVERLIGCVMRSVVGMLYVVDNAPDDVMARLCEGHERICYIANDRNEGYGRGHNRAIRMATGAGARYLLGCRRGCARAVARLHGGTPAMRAVDAAHHMARRACAAPVQAPAEARRPVPTPFPSRQRP